MTDWPERPVIYEVNTAAWLEELSGRHGHALTLADVSGAEWAAITPEGVDAVWLMGVWQRSPAGRNLALDNPQLMNSFRDALPDLAVADVVGSPYCVAGYVVDHAFGGPDGLARARSSLAARGVRLVLDYVPNHVAPDHRWVHDLPGVFVQGEQHDLDADPTGWIAVDGHILAHGRDPYFPPWPDVVQLNAFAPQMRAATVETLNAIADQCDGIRCDMAMLMTNQIFERTWGSLVGPAPTEEFWPTIIAELHQEHPEIVLIAEAYWDMEATLQDQGFNFCYDKRLYDRLLAEDPAAVRAHLGADVSYQSRLLRFLENHDEPRVASRLTRDPERAAAIALATLPGATMWHEGQFEGRQIRLPVFLSRRPDEPVDPVLADWHRQLVATVAGHDLRSGDWRLLDTTGWPDNRSHANLLAWSWTADSARHLVVVNMSDRASQGRIRLGWTDLHASQQFTDLLQGTAFVRAGAELTGDGLYVDLGPWQSHVLTVE